LGELVIKTIKKGAEIAIEWIICDKIFAEGFCVPDFIIKPPKLNGDCPLFWKE